MHTFYVKDGFHEKIVPTTNNMPSRHVCTSCCISGRRRNKGFTCFVGLRVVYYGLPRTTKPRVFTWSETDQYSSLYKEIRFLFVINGRKKTKAEESSHVALCTYVRRRRARRRNYGSKQARDTKREVILFRNRP